jgi:hypothetical protein
MRTLSQMHNYPTAYEVVCTVHISAYTLAELNAEICNANLAFVAESSRLGFSERRTRGALLSFAQGNSEAILSKLGTWDGEATYTVKSGWLFGPVRIHFSGLTERQCANESAAA